MNFCNIISLLSFCKQSLEWHLPLPQIVCCWSSNLVHLKVKLPHVVYLDEQTGALHTVCWLKSSFLYFPGVEIFTIFSLFSLFWWEKMSKRTHLLVEIYNCHNSQNYTPILKLVLTILFYCDLYTGSQFWTKFKC